MNNFSLRTAFSAILLLLAPTLMYAQETQSLTGRATGTIVGTVKDSKNESLPGVTIKVENGTAGAVTDIDGSYRITLPEGKYNINYSYISFATRRITDVEVKAGDITDLNIVLEENSGKTVLNEVVVTATYRQASVEGLYNKQKNNSAISDGISAEQIRRTPDNNAAQVLRRVSGLTIQDNKFVTVRGMSERYNNVMLNGSLLPSTEPNRRNFSFDILPSNMIDNIIVNKTATPDMPGEFAGGTVQVMTKDIPDNNVVNASIGSGYNTNSIGQKFNSIKREGSEYVGKIGDNRDWWWGKWNQDRYRDGIAAGTPSGYKDVTAMMRETIPNNWGLYQYKYSPVQQYQASVGRIFPLKNERGNFGLTVAGTYRHEEYKTDILDFLRPADFDLKGAQYDLTTTLAGIANVAYQNKNNKIAFKNLYTRRLTHTTTQYIGQTFDGALDDTTKAYIDGVSSSIIYQNKLEGEHVLTNRKIKVTWNIDRANLVRETPDLRASVSQGTSYGLGEKLLNFNKGALAILNSHLEETRFNYGANVTVPFRIAGAEQKVKAGFLNSRRNADFTFSGMKLVNTPSSNIFDQISDRPDYFIGKSEYLNENGLYYNPAGPSDNSSPDSYSGEQNLTAAYAMLDLKIAKDIRFIGGARMESNKIEVTTVTFTYPPSGTVEVDRSPRTYKSTNILPSFNIVYSLNKKMNIRGAYSKTLARPDFRERSPFLYYDFNELITYAGASGLRDTKTDNIDLRYEFYPKSGEIFSASLFYKKFKDPVELVQRLSGSGSATNFFFNLKSSTNYGFEMDFRKSLDFISSSQIAKNFYVSGNFTYMISEVEFNIKELLDASAGVLDTNSVSKEPGRKRALQGLSPYIINGAVGYQSKTIGAQVSYNRIGQRIVIGGPNPWEDQYENARDVIDLQISKRFWKNRLDVRFNVSDLLQQNFIIYQNIDDKIRTAPANSSIDAGPKGNAYDKDRDMVRQKTYRGSNVSLTIGLQL